MKEFGTELGNWRSSGLGHVCVNQDVANVWFACGVLCFAKPH